MPTLTPPQAEFISRPERFRALVSGFGGGKTWSACAALCKTAWEHPGAMLGYFGPTHSHTRDIFFPTIEEVADDWGLDVDIYVANREAVLRCGREIRATVVCRSMDRPETIVGFKLARAVVDEIDTLPQRKAEVAWRKIIARLRQNVPGLENGADVTTTPEGFNFVYKTWVSNLRENPELAKHYYLVQSSTYDNAHNLPDGYIDSLVASYPQNLIDAYLHGQFVNLQHGNVYPDFDRELNASTETVKHGEPIYIGMDFNVGKMAAVVCVKRNKEAHIVDEIINAYDTPDIVRRIKERFWNFDAGEYKPSRDIFIYPDSSGGSRKTVGASQTDISLLKQDGFIVRAKKANPPIRDRVNSMNAMICSAQRERRLFINPETAPRTLECIEKQAYTESGEPDKTHDYDHPADALGYFICYDFSLKRPVSIIKMGTAW